MKRKRVILCNTQCSCGTGCWEVGNTANAGWFAAIGRVLAGHSEMPRARAQIGEPRGWASTASARRVFQSFPKFHAWHEKGLCLVPLNSHSGTSM